MVTVAPDLSCLNPLRTIMLRVRRVKTMTTFHVRLHSSTLGMGQGYELLMEMNPAQKEVRRRENIGRILSKFHISAETLSASVLELCDDLLIAITDVKVNASWEGELTDVFFTLAVTEADKGLHYSVNGDSGRVVAAQRSFRSTLMTQHPLKDGKFVFLVTSPFDPEEKLEILFDFPALS